MNDSSATHGRPVEIALTFIKLGALGYGGPAIMGIMQSEIQEKRGWMSKARFLDGLALVNMLAGPIATQPTLLVTAGCGCKDAPLQRLKELV